jgi:hypothetical protein
MQRGGREYEARAHDAAAIRQIKHDIRFPPFSRTFTIACWRMLANP